MRPKPKFISREVKLARSLWGGFSPLALRVLLDLLAKNHFSIAAGDLILLERRWYVTHTGLFHLAERNRCSGIDARLLSEFSKPEVSAWTFKATVYKSADCRGFVGYGDADPSNVSSLVRGAEMRVAETRAVNRALRKAYGIGICSVEEIGSFADPPPATTPDTKKLPSQSANGKMGITAAQRSVTACVS